MKETLEVFFFCFYFNPQDFFLDDFAYIGHYHHLRKFLKNPHSSLWFGLQGLSGLQDLLSLTRDQTHIPHSGRWILNHWITREVPEAALLFMLS